MYQPSKHPTRNLHSRGTRVRKVDNLFNALRVLDRAVVEVSMQIYKVPQRDRAVMLQLHRRLHDSLPQVLPGSLNRRQRSF